MKHLKRTIMASVISILGVNIAYAQGDQAAKIVGSIKSLSTLRAEILHTKGIQVEVVSKEVSGRSDYRQIGHAGGAYIGLGVGTYGSSSSAHGNSISYMPTETHHILKAAVPEALDIGEFKYVCTGGKYDFNHSRYSQYEVMSSDRGQVYTINGQTKPIDRNSVMNGDSVNKKLESDVQGCLDSGKCISNEDLESLQNKLVQFRAALTDLETLILDFESHLSDSKGDAALFAQNAERTSAEMKSWINQSKMITSKKVFGSHRAFSNWNSIYNCVAINIVDDTNVQELSF